MFYSSVNPRCFRDAPAAKRALEEEGEEAEEEAAAAEEEEETTETEEDPVIEMEEDDCPTGSEAGVEVEDPQKNKMRD
jgi:hypothetical protein